jgi:preprotein translocase subunit SecY
VSRIPNSLVSLWADQATRWLSIFLTMVFTTATIIAIVFVQQGRRVIPVMYPGRRMGGRMSMPVRGSLPLMVNMAGMIPLIFAQSLLTFPAIIASFFTGSATQWVRNVALWFSSTFGGQSNSYHILYFLSVVAFTFFYTNVLFQQQNYGESLKRIGAQVPGVTKGPPTQRYLNRVLSRITLPGALFLGFVAILPWLVGLVIPLGKSNGLMLVQSAGLLIVVGVVRDLFYSIDAELKLHGYDEVLIK